MGKLEQFESHSGPHTCNVLVPSLSTFRFVRRRCRSGYMDQVGGLRERRRAQSFLAGENKPVAKSNIVPSSS